MNPALPKQSSVDSTCVDLHYEVDNYEFHEYNSLDSGELEQLGVQQKDLERFAQYLAGQPLAENNSSKSISENLQMQEKPLKNKSLSNSNKDTVLEMNEKSFSSRNQLESSTDTDKLLGKKKSSPKMKRMFTVDLNSSPDSIPISSPNSSSAINRYPKKESTSWTTQFEMQKQLREAILKQQQQSNLPHHLMLFVLILIAMAFLLKVADIFYHTNADNHEPNEATVELINRFMAQFNDSRIHNEQQRQEQLIRANQDNLIQILQKFVNSMSSLSTASTNNQTSSFENQHQLLINDLQGLITRMRKDKQARSVDRDLVDEKPVKDVKALLSEQLKKRSIQFGPDKDEFMNSSDRTLHSPLNKTSNFFQKLFSPWRF